MFFSNERRPVLKEENPDWKFGEFGKAIGAEWAKVMLTTLRLLVLYATWVLCRMQHEGWHALTVRSNARAPTTSTLPWPLPPNRRIRYPSRRCLPPNTHALYCLPMRANAYARGAQC